MKTWSLGLWLLASTALVACAPSTYKVHHTLREAPEARAPKKIVVLPADIRVSEMTLGGVVEKVDDWTRQASLNVENALRAHIGSKPNLKTVNLPRLSREDELRVDQHRALYDQVAGSAFLHTMGNDINVWRHKNELFDYTLGGGLKFLKAQTGADAAVIAVGEDTVSSAGRKTAYALGAIVGVEVALGHSFLTVGVVDLQTGDLLWFDYKFYPGGSHDMRDADDSGKIVRSILANYPGVKSSARNVSQQ